MGNKLIFSQTITHYHMKTIYLSTLVLTLLMLSKVSPMCKGVPHGDETEEATTETNQRRRTKRERVSNTASIDTNNRNSDTSINLEDEIEVSERPTKRTRLAGVLGARSSIFPAYAVCQIAP